MFEKFKESVSKPWVLESPWRKLMFVAGLVYTVSLLASFCIMFGAGVMRVLGW